MSKPCRIPMPCCASVPVSALELVVFVCHHHGAVRAHVEVRADVSDETDPGRVWPVSFGPFDSWADIEAQVHSLVGSAWPSLPVPGQLQH
jgi:hypothetical protein